MKKFKKTKDIKKDIQQDIKTVKQVVKKSIQKKMTASYARILVASYIAAAVALLAMGIMVIRYDNALTNYGFAQGDIGKAMTTFAEARSYLLGTIGYREEANIEDAQKAYEDKKEKCINYIAEIEDHMATKAGKEAYEKLTDDFTGYWELSNSILERGATTDAELSKQAQKQLLEKLTPMYDTIYDDFASLMDVNVSKGEQAERDLTNLAIACFGLIVILVVVSSILSLRKGKKMAKSIAGPIGELEERLKTFAEGDLESPFPEATTGDEIERMIKIAGGMASNINLIIEDMSYLFAEMAKGNLAVHTENEDKYVGKFSELILSAREMNGQISGVIGQVKEAAEQVTAGSENLASAAQDLAEGSTEQAGAVEELQATIETVTTAAERTAADLGHSYDEAKKYAGDADQSRVQMKAMVEAMRRISETSEKIGNIISDLEDIAGQTNLLSLNASIEAARAGEVGRGFAVVADEIRQLAEQSAQSAVSTRELIETALHEVAEGNKAVDIVSDTLDEVVVGMDAIAEKSKSLSEQSASQADAMEQLELGVNQISEVVQSNSATAEETSATSEELYAQAESMGELVKQFKL